MTDGDLKIQGGEFAGRSVYTPDQAEVRPMRSRIREAVFDRISTRIQGRCVLDCFAGTGAMGVEALSRGAGYTIFFDWSEEAVACIRNSVRKLHLMEKTDIRQRDLLRDFMSVERDDVQFISVTPPYPLLHEPESRRELFHFLGRIGQGSILKRGGQLLLECESGTRIGEAPHGFKRMDQTEFGRTELHLFTTS